MVWDDPASSFDAEPFGLGFFLLLFEVFLLCLGLAGHPLADDIRIRTQIEVLILQVELLNLVKFLLLPYSHLHDYQLY